MSALVTLEGWGIQRPDAVISAAAATGLPLALACALLDQESHGGDNVWGHDAVDTGGIYTKGGPVTRENYLAYRRLADLGRIGRQGVGPCQLTGRDWQDGADQRGGCWDPHANMLAGFTGLAARINTYGLADGIRRYNGSGPAAEIYRDRVLARYRAWIDRLGPPTKGDDVAWTHAEGAPAIPDFYPGKPAGSTLPDPAVALGFATAHAAVARDYAHQALDAVHDLRQDILSGAIAPTIDYARLAAALLAAIGGHQA